VEKLHHQDTKNTKSHRENLKDLVIPAKAGIQRGGLSSTTPDASLRRDDDGVSVRYLAKRLPSPMHFLVNLGGLGVLVVKALFEFEDIRYGQP
jgi:hypothetical protein